MRISYCSSDVFSSDLQFGGLAADAVGRAWMDRGRGHLAHFDGSSRGIRGRGLHDDVAAGTDTLVSVVEEQLVGRLAVVQGPVVGGLRLVYAALRSEERRVGKECVSTCRSRWSRDH